MNEMVTSSLEVFFFVSSCVGWLRWAIRLLGGLARLSFCWAVGKGFLGFVSRKGLDLPAFCLHFSRGSVEVVKCKGCVGVSSSKPGDGRGWGG